MSYFFIALIRIHDKTLYDRYLERAGEIFAKFNGKYLVLDDRPMVMEGSWDYTRTVVIEFRSKTDFESWYTSDEYREILNFRLNAADCNSILACGSD